MKDQHELTGTLESIERMPSSLNGNPRYLVVIETVKPGIMYRTEARTAVDSSLAYEVPNFENKIGQQVTVEIGMHYNQWHLIDIEDAEPVGAVTVHWMEDSTGKRGFFNTYMNCTLDSAREYFMQDVGHLNIGDGEHDRVVRVLLVHKAGEPTNA